MRLNFTLTFMLRPEVATYPEIPKRSWIWTSLLSLFFAASFERALGPIDGWFSKQGSLHYAGFLLTPIAIALAASLAGSMFMRKFGSGRSVRRRLATTSATVLAIWMVLSLGLRLVLFVPRQTLLTNLSAVEVIALVTVLETAVGCALAWSLVIWRGRQMQNYNERNSPLGGVA